MSTIATQAFVLSGSEFNNAITEELFTLTGIVHKLTGSYHPQGMVCILY